MRNLTLALALVVSCLSAAFSKVESFEVEGNNAYVQDATKPDKVTAWVGIYPVCNLASYPLRFSNARNSSISF